MIVDQRILDIEPREIIKGYNARFLHTDTLTIAFWEVEPNAELPMHNHVHEQVSQILEGEFEMTINGITKIHKPGSIVVIPSNVEHKGKAITACKILDIFSPVREDYK
ncbi:cupin domain-containing protein [uncultured Winogradskyella sp.]|uniref:cupin domain-containing protein n=1 Tax=uncultured Winogradskyella sp. TaxID=395353 RepID=UPI00261F1306|nr:cupin domain-containing protein [uncultured Winogradskyella sp.]